MKLKNSLYLALFSFSLVAILASCAGEKEKVKDDSMKQATAELELIVKEAIEALPAKEFAAGDPREVGESFEEAAPVEEEISKPKVYFSGSVGTIHMSLERYAKIYDIESHEGQIDYLLTRMRTSNFELERNGTKWPVSQGAEFLRWKMGRPKWQGKVNSSRDFVKLICQGSSTSGKSYLAFFPDGTIVPMGTIFTNELDFLEEFLKAKAIKKAAKTSKKEAIEKLNGTEYMEQVEQVEQEVVVVSGQLAKVIK